MYSRAATEGLPEQYRGLRESTDDPQRPIRTLHEFLRNYRGATFPRSCTFGLCDQFDHTVRIHNWGENKADFLLADMYGVSIETPSSVILTLPEQVGHPVAPSRHTSLAAASPCCALRAALTLMMGSGRTVVV